VAYALGVARARWRWRRLRRGGATVTALAAALGVTAAAGVAVAVLRARGRPPPVYAVGDDHDAGWAWIRAHAGGRRIAYTGSNLPFPLWGARLENDVRYVNVVDAPGALLHHFVGALDVAAPAAAVTAEPAPYREAADQATWLANLETLRIEILFVAALYPVVRRVVAHDGDGFPDERAWADARPGRFRLVFANDGVRIYAVSAASAGSAGR
jgi:hypothetical protein